MVLAFYPISTVDGVFQLWSLQCECVGFNQP